MYVHLSIYVDVSEYSRVSASIHSTVLFLSHMLLRRKEGSKKGSFLLSLFLLSTFCFFLCFSPSSSPSFQSKPTESEKMRSDQKKPSLRFLLLVHRNSFSSSSSLWRRGFGGSHTEKTKEKKKKTHTAKERTNFIFLRNSSCRLHKRNLLWRFSYTPFPRDGRNESSI